MTKRCMSETILNIMSETRMRTLEPDVRMLWLDIVTMMQRDNVSALRFGKSVLHPSGLAKLIPRPQTETETDFESKITELCDRGLLSVEQDGAIGCPLLKAMLSRSELNKINGSKGGRPRKDSDSSGQTSTPLRTEGNNKKPPSKTGARTKKTAGNVNNSATTYLLNNRVKEVSESEVAKLGNEVLLAMGRNPDGAETDFEPVEDWLKAGATCELVLGVIERRKRPGIYTLRYFDGAIVDALQAVEPEKADWERDWQADYDDWKVFGRGIRPAPMPENYKRP